MARPSGLDCAMDQKPGIRDLLWRRHINPWNWWSQAFCLFLLVPGLWLRNKGLLGLALFGGAAAAFLDLKLPPMRRLGLGGSERLAARIIRLEHDWRARPWDRRKKLQAAMMAVAAPLLGLALWTQDLPALVVALGAGYLARVVLQNKRDGIDP